jgi:lipoprotein-anchoring transpeptidase ErfK/SrfK
MVMQNIGKIALAVLLAATILAVPADARRKRYHHQQAIHHSVKKHYRKKIRRPAPPAAVVAKVDISSQTMTVTVNGFPYAYWRVSTGRKGFNTPFGSFRVGRMAKMHYSKKYDNAPMPNSLFFYGGFAVHGTGHTKQLGRPASHGCVRLAPGNAATLYSLAQTYGGRRVRVVIVQ